MRDRPLIVVLTQAGLTTAERVREAIGEAEVCGLAARVEGADRAFDDVGGELRAAFGRGRPLVGICAAGILVRALAVALRDKAEEPPVLAVAEDGAAVVPLLGGHRGANALARRIAAALGVEAAITTAGDARWAVALDCPPLGWTLVNPEHYKAFAAALLAGAAVRLEGEAEWLERSGLPFDPAARLVVEVTEKPAAGGPERLVFAPKRHALGVGCERGTAPEELLALVERSLSEANLSAHALAGVFSLDLKSDEPAVHALACHLGLPARFFGAAALEAMTPRLANPSERVFGEVGCHGVAEGAALAAAGDSASLVLAKRKSARATCAIARSAAVLHGSRIGRPRGCLAVVGLGPGKAEWRTPAADRAIREADHVVGYAGYLEHLGPLDPDQTPHPYPLGEETERVDHALTLASLGHRVALVCSGDPGVYAMASLVFERLEQSRDGSWRRVAIDIVPGVSAMHAAAALGGAPLGHDFCAISLSDLLTPWAVIEERLRAAAAGDFVVALYNPASARRRRPLEGALSILRAHRCASTPVIVARQVGRAGERVTVTTLGGLEAGAIDMLTLLLVGSSESRRLELAGGARVYTPRGYAPKSRLEALP